MPRDFTSALWLLKLGAPLNLYFAWQIAASPLGGVNDPHLIVPAQILLLVSAYRCLFPNRYKGNVVLHATPLSSTLVTRVLATGSEVAYIYLFSYALRQLNVDGVGWIDALAWLMVVQVVVSQGFVWGQLLTGRLMLFVFEEAGWFVIFAANAIASAALLLGGADPGDREILLNLNLVFAAGYLPWQVIHLRALWLDARAGPVDLSKSTADTLGGRLWQLLVGFRVATDAESWGGWVGLTWMTAYWATLIPVWVYVIVRVLVS